MGGCWGLAAAPAAAGPLAVPPTDPTTVLARAPPDPSSVPGIEARAAPVPVLPPPAPPPAAPVCAVEVATARAPMAALVDGVAPDAAAPGAPTVAVREGVRITSTGAALAAAEGAAVACPPIIMAMRGSNATVRGRLVPRCGVAMLAVCEACCGAVRTNAAPQCMFVCLRMFTLFDRSLF